MSDKLLEVKDLRISAYNDEGVEIPIVKGVSFDIHKGQVVALIGESGSGKTTISLASLSYTKPGLEFSGGEVLLNGEDVLVSGWSNTNGAPIPSLSDPDEVYAFTFMLLFCMLLVLISYVKQSFHVRCH